MDELTHILSRLQAALEAETVQVSAIEEAPVLMKNNLCNLKDVFREAGDVATSVMEQARKDESAERIALFILFALPERAKGLLILGRDILFQHMKGRLLASDGQLGQGKRDAHWKESAQVFQAAVAEAKAWIEQEQEAYEKGDVATKRLLEQWRLQNSPWEVYRSQYDEITGQVEYLIENQEKTTAAGQVFRQMTELIRDTIDRCQTEVEQLRELAGQTQSWLEEQATKESPGKIVSKLEQTEKNLVLLNHISAYTRQMEPLADQLPKKWQTAVETQGGLLLYNELDLRRRATQWVEGEVLPLLYEIWELTEGLHNGIRMSLSNIRNRVLLLPSQTESGFDAGSLVHPLLQNREWLEKDGVQIKNLDILIKSRLDEYFRVSAIYDTEKPFLPLSMQATVRQFSADQERLWERTRKWTAQKLSAWTTFQSKVKKEEQLGVAEKTVRYIESRQPDPANQHYTSIFLTKGFAGASFASGREAEMEHFGNLVRQWEKGFRGAAMLTGRRFSGKTFFGEWMSVHFFPARTLRIMAGAELNHKGRKMPGTYHLEEALGFIRKYALNDRILLWIDDLELWQNEEHTLYENVKALMHFTNRNATRCFVMVAMSHWAYRRLNMLFDTDLAFQAVFRLDSMEQQHISQAILIHHGATHKKLVTREGDEMTPALFRSLAQRIGRAAHGNVGEAMLWWAASIRFYDDDRVYSDFSDRYNLPTLDDTDTGVLLSEVLLQKRTDEYRLRRQFGAPFSNRFSSLVRQLLGVGLLHRLPDGSLEVRECAVNAVAGLLEQEGFV